MVNIYSLSGEILFSVPVVASAISHEELMTADYVQLEWEAEGYVCIPAGAYIMHDGERYSLLEPYYPSMKNDVACKYSPQFKSRIMRWEKAFVPVYTYHEDGVTVKARELDWTFVGTPADAMSMVRQAIRHETGETWSVELGDDLPETIELNAQSATIWGVLAEIAEQCKTEWWAKKSANYLYLSKCIHGVSVALEVGRNVKVPSVSQNSDSQYFTRFYAFGSTRNITSSDAVVQGSIVKKRLTLDPKKYPMGYKDIKGHYENGVFVSDLLPQEVFPTSLYFEDVYPSSSFQITNVRKRMRYYLDDDGNRIKIGGTDASPIYEQYAIWYFQIDGFDFTEDHIIENMTLSAAFKSGQLRGREFELTYHSETKKVADVADVDKEFSVYAGEYEIIMDDSVEGMIIPGVDYLVPEELNAVTLFNIEMPSEYTDSAMVELEKKLDDEIEERLKDCKSYEFSSNPVAFYEEETDVSLGQSVRFVNGGETLDTRVLMVEKHIDYPYEQKIRVGNELIKGSRQQLREEVKNISEDVVKLRESESVSSVARRDHARDLMTTMGRYYAMRDTIDLLKDAVDGFEPGINPVTIETMAMFVGDESLQFRFTRSRSNLEPIDCPLVYDPSQKQINANACALFHLTLDVPKEISNSYSLDAYKSWNMETWHSEIVEDATTPYYVYAKVEREGAFGTYELSKTIRKMRGTVGYYYLLVGILNSEYAGTREFITLYGFTEVLPGQITTDVIRSADGNTYFDLAKSKIVGEIAFAAGSSGLENLSEWSEKQTQIDNATSKAAKAIEDAKKAQESANAASAASAALEQEIADIETGFNQSIQEINQKLDGVVESFFDKYTPTRDNEPAKTWIVEETEADHIGDTFTNTETEGENAGKSWRWLKQENGTYDWQPIADSDATKALALAAEAQATADGKRTIFLAKPKSYSDGDIWILESDSVIPPYKKGDMLNASVKSSSFVSTHWSKMVRYADSSDLTDSVDQLNKAIEDAESASKKYTDEGKKALQNAIDALEEAKADITEVYTMAQADGLIKKAEADAIKKAQELADAAEEAAIVTAKAYADGEIDDAEKRAIAEAEKKVKQAKEAFGKALADLDTKLSAEVQSAIDSANSAIDDAQSAIEAANKAQTDATEAGNIAKNTLQTAQDALNSATNANVTASAARALADAADSLSKVASENANKAITDASSAMNRANDANSLAETANELAGVANELADTAKKAAESAQKKADKAEGDAKTANDTLVEWASNDIISPIEKQKYAEEYTTALADYSSIKQDAELNGFTTEDIIYSSFESAFVAYRNDLQTIVNSSEDSLNAPIGFSTHIASYYSARRDLLVAIAEKTKGASDEARNAAESANKTAKDAETLATQAKAIAEAAHEAADDANRLISSVDGDTTLTGIEKRSLREAMSKITSVTDSSELFETIQVRVGAYEVVENPNGDGNPYVVQQGSTNNGNSQQKYVGWNALSGLGTSSVNAARIKILMERSSEITIEYASDAESRYDFLVMGVPDVDLNLSNSSFSAYIADNQDPSEPTSTKDRQGAILSKRFALSEGEHYIDVAYRTDGSNAIGTDSGYFRVVGASYGEAYGDSLAVTGDGSFEKYYNKLIESDKTEDAQRLLDCLTDILDFLNANGVWVDGNSTVSRTFRSELQGLIAEYGGYEADGAFAIATDWEYLKGTFAKGTTNVSGGVVMTNMVAVNDIAESDIEAFLNGSDFADDSEHKKLILAAGIPSQDEQSGSLEERSRKAATRVYEDGTIDTRRIFAKGGKIGDFEISEVDSGVFLKADGDRDDSKESVTMQLSGYGLQLHSERATSSSDSPAYKAQSTVYPTSLYSGIFRNEFKDTSKDSTTTPTPCMALIVGAKGAKIYDNSQSGGNYAIYNEYGMIGGLRPRVRAVNIDTITLSSIDHTVLVTEACTITLPSAPQNGQEYEILCPNPGAVIIQSTKSKIYLMHDGVDRQAFNAKDLGGSRQVVKLVYFEGDGKWFGWHNVY